MQLQSAGYHIEEASVPHLFLMCKASKINKYWDSTFWIIKLFFLHTMFYIFDVMGEKIIVNRVMGNLVFMSQNGLRPMGIDSWSFLQRLWSMKNNYDCISLLCVCSVSWVGRKMCHQGPVLEPQNTHTLNL